MFGSSAPGIEVPISLIPTPGIYMPMNVSISAMVLEFPSLSTPMSTSPLIGSAVPLLVRGFWY